MAVVVGEVEINWSTARVTPLNNLLFKLTPVVRALDPMLNTLEVILSRVAALRPKIFVVVLAEPMLTMLAVLDPF